MSETNTHQLPYTDSQLNIGLGKMINFESSVLSTSVDFVTSDGVESSLGIYGFSNFTGNFFNTNYATDKTSNTRVLTTKAISDGVTVTDVEHEEWWDLPYGLVPHTIEIQHGLGRVPTSIHWGFTNFTTYLNYPNGARVEPSSTSVINAMIWADTDKVYWKFLPSPAPERSLFLLENYPVTVDNGTADGSPYRGSFELTYDYLGGSPTLTKVYEYNTPQGQWNGNSDGTASAIGERFVFDPTVGSNGRWKILYSGNNFLVANNDADEPWQVTQWVGNNGNTNVWLQNPSYDTTNITTFAQEYTIIRNRLVKVQVTVEA